MRLKIGCTSTIAHSMAKGGTGLAPCDQARCIAANIATIKLGVRDRQH
jgi:hypothetical protein